MKLKRRTNRSKGDTFVPEGLVIGYDGKRAVCNNTGIGNYSRCLVDALSFYYPKNEYILYSPKRRDNPALAPLLDRDNVRLETAGAMGRAMGSLWRSLEMTRRMADDGVSLIHGLSNELPLNVARADIPSVVTIHDLIWRRIPQNYSAADRRIYDWKYKASALRATRVIAISECTKRDIVNDFGVDPARIDVVYQACNPIFTLERDPAEAARIAALYNLPERYVLAVGTVEYRKNQLQAVKALRGLPADVRLVMVGRPHKGYAREISDYIAANSLADRVMWLRDVPTEHLPYLYAGARLASYTSRYEGFGLPVVEALSCGTPVIAATGSCLEEAGGGGAVYVDPDDVDMYIDAAARVIDDNFHYHKLADQGARQIRRFSVAEFARLTMATYTKAILDSTI